MLASWIMNTEHLYLVCQYVRVCINIPVYTCACVHVCTCVLKTSEDSGDLQETPSQAAKTHKWDVSCSARK